MANTKLSALSALAVEMANTDEIYLNDGGVSKRQLYSVFKAAFALAAHTIVSHSDAEEGVHVATVTCSTSGSYGLDAAEDTLAYTKNGRVVHLQGRLHITSESSPSGQLRVSIPHTMASLTETAGTARTPIVIILHGGTIVYPSAEVKNGLAYLALYTTADSGTSSTITDTDVDTDFFIDINISYIAA